MDNVFGTPLPPTELEVLRAKAEFFEEGFDCMKAENTRLRNWVNDLQAGMYINCVYCGHRYGPDDEVPATMADVLKEHIEQCPEHAMSALKAERVQLIEAVAAICAYWDDTNDGEPIAMDEAAARNKCYGALAKSSLAPQPPPNQ